MATDLAGSLHRVAVAVRRRPDRGGRQPVDGARHCRASAGGRRRVEGAADARGHQTLLCSARAHIAAGHRGEPARHVLPRTKPVADRIARRAAGRDRPGVHLPERRDCVPGGGGRALRRGPPPRGHGSPAWRSDWPARRPSRWAASCSRRSASSGSPGWRGCRPSSPRSQSGRHACSRWCRRSTTCSRLQRALLVLARRTRVITAATAVEAVTIGVVIAAGIGVLDVVGATAAAAAILTGRLGGNVYLRARSAGTAAGNHRILKPDPNGTILRAYQARAHVVPGGIMVPFARLIRMSAAAAALALAGFWLSGCSEASRMETQVPHRGRPRLHPARRHVREWPGGAAGPGPRGARLRPGLFGRSGGRVQHAGRDRRADGRHRGRPGAKPSSCT